MLGWVHHIEEWPRSISVAIIVWSLPCSSSEVRLLCVEGLPPCIEGREACIGVRGSCGGGWPMPPLINGAADEGRAGGLLSIGGWVKDLVAVGVGSYIPSCSTSSTGDARTGAKVLREGGGFIGWLYLKGSYSPSSTSSFGGGTGGGASRGASDDFLPGACWGGRGGGPSRGADALGTGGTVRPGGLIGDFEEASSVNVSSSRLESRL